MRILINHLTRYHYSRPVSFSEHFLFLRPRDNHKMRVESFCLDTSITGRQRWIRDCNNNIVLVVNFGTAETTDLSFKCTMVVVVDEDNPFDFLLEPYATAFPFRYRAHEAHALSPYLDTNVTPHSHHALDWIYTAIPDINRHPNTVEFLVSINQAINRDIQYRQREEEGIQSPNETLGLRCGSCRDFALLFIAICRQLGLAARFVSGYLYDPPQRIAHDEEHLFNRAVGSMHAWAEVFLPGAGWKGFDPTNGLLTNEYFIPSAVSYEPTTINPIQGRYFPADGVHSKLEIEVELAGA